MEGLIIIAIYHIMILFKVPSAINLQPSLARAHVHPAPSCTPGFVSANFPQFLSDGPAPAAFSDVLAPGKHLHRQCAFYDFVCGVRHT